MDLIQMLSWGEIGPAALLALTVLLILRGDIVPRRTYDAATKDRDYWRAAAIESAQQVRELAEVSKTAVAALDALKPPDGRAMNGREERS